MKHWRNTGETLETLKHKGSLQMLQSKNKGTNGQTNGLSDNHHFLSCSSQLIIDHFKITWDNYKLNPIRRGVLDSCMTRGGAQSARIGKSVSNTIQTPSNTPQTPPEAPRHFPDTTQTPPDNLQTPHRHHPDTTCHSQKTSRHHYNSTKQHLTLQTPLRHPLDTSQTPPRHPQTPPDITQTSPRRWDTPQTTPRHLPDSPQTPSRHRFMLSS